MSTPISAMTTCATMSLTPGIVVSRSAEVRSGSSRVPTLESSFAMASSAASNLTQVQSQQESVMVCRIAAQSLHAHSPRSLHAIIDQIGQALRVALPSDERFQNCPAALAENIGEHARELQIGVFKHLLYPLHVLRFLSHQLLARSR